MWHLFHRLTETDAREAAIGRHAAGRGLWLCKQENGAADWQICLTVRGNSRDVKLGDYPAMSVKQARAEAAKWRDLARRGLDPGAEQEAFRDAAARNLDQFYC